MLQRTIHDRYICGFNLSQITVVAMLKGICHLSDQAEVLPISRTHWLPVLLTNLYTVGRFCDGTIKSKMEPVLRFPNSWMTCSNSQFYLQLLSLITRVFLVSLISLWLPSFKKLVPVLLFSVTLVWGLSVDVYQFVISRNEITSNFFVGLVL